MAEIIVQIPEAYTDRSSQIVTTLSKVLTSHKFVLESTPPTQLDTIQLTSYTNLDLGLATLASVASNIHRVINSAPSIVFESNTSNVSYP